MANEFKHKSVGTELTQTEFEAVGGHVLDYQARGDIIYASSTKQLSRLGVGGAGAVLTSDGTDPVWDTTWSPTGHLIPASDDSYDLGSASAAWQDLFLGGDITLTDAGTLATSAGALTVTSAAAATWSTSAGALTLNGTGGVNLQEGGSTIISISDARALATTNTASVDLDATGAIQVNSSGGALSIGNDNVDQTINIATAGTRTLNIGIGDGTDITTTVVKGTLSVGVDDAGYDVVFYGDTASANMTWDTSVDDLILNGAARIVVPDGQLVLGSTAVGSTAAELNLLDGSAKSTSSITLADADAFIVIDGTTTKQIPASDLATYITAEGSMNSFQLEDDSGDEVTINNANEIKFIGSGITTNWTDTDNGTDGDPYDMTFTVDAAQTGITSVYNASLAVGYGASHANIDFSTDNAIILDIDGTQQVKLVDGVLQPITDSDVDLGTTGVRWKDAFVDSLTVTDNVIVSGNLTVNGTTTTVDTATLAVVDPIVHLQTASDGGALGSDTNKDVGIAMQYHTGSAAKQAFLGIDDSDSYKLMFIPDASLSSEVVSGSVGTIKANLEGDVTGDVTGNTSGTAATVTGAAQSNITSLGTLTTLTVDNVIVNGTTTTVNSTIVTIDDPVFTLGGDTPPASETTKDKGIEFRYHTGSAAKIGFFGWDDDASSFTFIADATNNSEVFSGSAGNVIFGNITGTLQTAAQANVTSLGTLTGLTINGDLTLTGASYNVVWDKSDNALEFSDDSILRIGDGSDLDIFHSSNVNFLKTQTNSVLKFVSASDADILKLTPNGAVDLYFNNNLVLTTTNSGIKIPNSGNIGCTSDTDLMTLASGVLTIAGELDATSLDISGNADIDGTLNVTETITVDKTATSATEIAKFKVSGTGGSSGNESFVSILPGSDNFTTQLRLHTNNTGSTFQTVSNKSGILELATTDSNPIVFKTND